LGEALWYLNDILFPGHFGSWSLSIGVESFYPIGLIMEPKCMEAYNVVEVKNKPIFKTKLQQRETQAQYLWLGTAVSMSWCKAVNIK
jgi:hypothetical protein